MIAHLRGGPNHGEELSIYNSFQTLRVPIMEPITSITMSKAPISYMRYGEYVFDKFLETFAGREERAIYVWQEPAKSHTSY